MFIIGARMGRPDVPLVRLGRFRGAMNEPERDNIVVGEVKLFFRVLKETSLPETRDSLAQK